MGGSKKPCGLLPTQFPNSTAHCTIKLQCFICFIKTPLLLRTRLWYVCWEPAQPPPTNHVSFLCCCTFWTVAVELVEHPTGILAQECLPWMLNLFCCWCCTLLLMPVGAKGCTATIKQLNTVILLFPIGYVQNMIGRTFTGRQPVNCCGRWFVSTQSMNQCLGNFWVEDVCMWYHCTHTCSFYCY